MLAERATVDVEEAFAWLRGHARHHNLRLAAVAQGVLDGTVTLNMIHASRPTRRAQWCVAEMIPSETTESAEPRCEALASTYMTEGRLGGRASCLRRHQPRDAPLEES